MWLVLCERGDLAALWAYRGLAARGLMPIELVTADALAYAMGWEHRLGSAGMSIEIALADGRSISGDSVRGVLNRIVSIPNEHHTAAAPGDVDYARQELYAFFLSWLNALPGPVLNRPTPQGLSGPWLQFSEWLMLAARAGLRTPSYRRASTDLPEEPGTQMHAPALRRTTIVISGEIIPASTPSTVAVGCTRLASLVQADLLAVELTKQCVFATASPLPDLRLGGQPLLELLHSALRGGHAAA